MSCRWVGRWQWHDRNGQCTCLFGYIQVNLTVRRRHALERDQAVSTLPPSFPLDPHAPRRWAILHGNVGA